MGKSPMSLALVDLLAKMGVRPSEATAIYFFIERQQWEALHPDDLAAMIWKEMREREQAAYEQGLNEAQMVLNIPFVPDYQRKESQGEG